MERSLPPVRLRNLICFITEVSVKRLLKSRANNEFYIVLEISLRIVINSINIKKFVEEDFFKQFPRINIRLFCNVKNSIPPRIFTTHRR